MEFFLEILKIIFFEVMVRTKQTKESLFTSPDFELHKDLLKKTDENPDADPLTLIRREVELMKAKLGKS